MIDSRRSPFTPGSGSATSLAPRVFNRTRESPWGCPHVEVLVIAGVPGVAEPGTGQVPVRADRAGHRAQVLPEFGNGRPAPEPVAVVDGVDDQSGLEHEGVWDHRVVLGV